MKQADFKNGPARKRLEKLAELAGITDFNLKDVQSVQIKLPPESYQAVIPEASDLLECPEPIALTVSKELIKLRSDALKKARKLAEFESYEEKRAHGEINESTPAPSIEIEIQEDPAQLSSTAILGNETELLAKGLCPECHEQVHFQNGCLTCMSCGYSKCG